jgi:hypothetical protein
MSSLKKINRNQNKLKKKSAVKAMKYMEKAVNSIPKHCFMCEKPFDASVPNALSTWMVSVNSQGSTMTCPECWAQRPVQ